MRVKGFEGLSTRASTAVTCCGLLAAGVALILLHRRCQQQLTRRNAEGKLMVFEMLEGQNPFDTSNMVVIVRHKVLATKTKPVELSSPGRESSYSDFIARTMAYSAAERVVNVGGGMASLKKQGWLKGVDWEALRAMRLPAPWKPDGGPCYDGMEGWDGEDFDDDYTGDQTIFEEF